MRDLTVGGYWGNVFFSAADQARFFLVFDKLVPPRSRAYARQLLSSIVSYQRWGFSRFSLRRGWQHLLQGRLAHDRTAARSCTRRPCSSAAAGASRWRC